MLLAYVLVDLKDRFYLLGACLFGSVLYCLLRCS